MLRQNHSRKEQESSREPWPYLAAVFLVSLLVRQEKGKAIKTKDGYGMKCSASFAKLDRAGLWRKTSGGYSQLSLTETGDICSEEFSATWPKMGIVLAGYAMELEISEHPTKGNGSLSWRTPHASCSTGPGKQGRQGGKNLQTAIWPTPTTPGEKGSGRLDEWGGRGNPARGTMQGRGQLNPAWVECLMGFPMGWLDIDGPRDGGQRQKQEVTEI